MQRLKILLVSLAVMAFSGCAAYSVINNDRYYDSRSSLPEGQYSQLEGCRSKAQDLPMGQQLSVVNCRDVQR